MKRLPWAPSLLVVLLASTPVVAFAQEEEGEEQEDPLAKSYEEALARREHVQQKITEFMEKRKAAAQEFRGELEGKARQAEELGEELDVRSGDVAIDTVKEPDTPDKVVDTPPIANMWDASELHFKIEKHEIWSLRPEDFRFWRPSRIAIERPLGTRRPYEVEDLVPQTKRTVFRDAFMVLPFALTNSSDRDLLICPHMWVVSENLRFTPETGGFIAQQDVENSMYRDMLSTTDLVGYDADPAREKLEPVQAFRAGETRYGVGVFPLPDLELDRMTLVVEGLNNTYRFDRRQKRVLAVEFEHLGDEFYPFREVVEFRGKEWKWLWMWYEEMEVGPPERYEFPTPMETRQKALWAYQVTLTNHSREPQPLEIRQFNTVIRTRALGVEIEVEFVDDGESTIHKTKVMEEMAQPFRGDRLFKGTIGPDEVKVFPVIFDEEDIDWAKVFEQVETGLAWDKDRERGRLSIGYGEEPLEPGFESFLPDQQKLGRLIEDMRNLRLSPSKMEQVRKEVLEGLAETFEAEKRQMRLTANVTAVSGVASGTFRIRRSYLKPGVVEEEWIHKWGE